VAVNFCYIRLHLLGGMMRFAVGLPEGHYEQTRLMTTSKDLKKIIDVLCRVTKYYPGETNKGNSLKK
jgi:hypothetical protein